MADPISFRIYENTEQTTPLSGWGVPVSKDGEVDEQLILSSHFTYEENIDIGTWDMSTTALKNITLTDIANIDRIEGIVIIDDDNYEYNGNALYDSYVHGQVLQDSSSVSKTVNITGTSASQFITGNTLTGNAGTRKTLGLLSISYEGQVTVLYKADGTTFTNGGKIGEIRRLNYLGNTGDIVVESIVVIDDGGGHEVWANTAKINKESAYIDVKIATTQTVVAFPTFIIKIVEKDLSDEHTHVFSNEHSHTLTGSGSTGTIFASNGFARKSVQVIARLDRANNRIQLTHNNPSGISEVMSSFGVFTVNQSYSTMQKYKQTSGDKNRGRIIIKRKFTEVI